MTHLTPPRQLPAAPPGPADRWLSADTPYPSASHRDGAPVDIAQLLGTIRRRAWMVVLACGIAAGIAWYVVRSRPQLYSARATVQLADVRQVLTSGLVGNDNDQQSYGVSVLSQTEVLKSRAVAAIVVDSEPLGLRVQTTGFPITLLSDVQLEDTTAAGVVDLTFTPNGMMIGADSTTVIPYGTPTTVNGLRFAVRQRPDVATGAVSVLSRERAIDYLLFNLDVSPRERTLLIDIAYTARSPIVAARVVNRVAHAYQSVNAHMAQEQVHRRRVFIEQQLARYDSLLTQAQIALSTFRSQQEAYSSQEQFAARQAGIRDLQTQVQQLQNERALSNDLLR
ncbi:MAG TPA: Wzz/FepE/Etk N-terminal domain-containing protein, partial [Gemmatimonadaceae bacterium]|nr:Wzz/FepE/Etk N-terminal domain-containing protein [Gemmatimonadaceae bacterium]